MSIHGCTDLWREVLFLTISDALHGAKRGSKKAAVKIAIEATNSARCFLTLPNADFDLICTYCGIDAEAARDRLRMLIAAAPSPEELIARSPFKRRRGSGRQSGAS